MPEALSASFITPQSSPSAAAERAADLYSVTPFPVSAETAAKTDKDIFSYAPEGGFVRVSFADIGTQKEKIPEAAAAGKGNLYGLISLDLKQGWKTYWRNPGSSGLPPLIELNGGAKAEILFPAPQLFQEDTEWTYGYKGHIALPFHIILPPQPRQDSYAGAITLGICETLCMPQKIPFRFSVKQSDNAAERSKILAALRSLPKPARQDFQILAASAVQGGVRFTLRYPHSLSAKTQQKPPHLFLDGGSMQIGLAHPLPTENASHKYAAHKDKSSELQIYEAAVLFGEAKAGERIAYTITRADGEAVSGNIEIKTAEK